MTYTLDQLNQMTQAEFVAVLGGVFEETPAIAAEVWTERPFDTVVDLHQAMLDAMYRMDEEQQLALICAHPDLGSKAAMAEASVAEQTSVGLDQLSADEFARFHALNQAYKTQFGFPFIVAVKHHTKASILAAFEQRLQQSRQHEMRQALSEIAEIARLRLAAMGLDVASAHG